MEMTRLFLGCLEMPLLESDYTQPTTVSQCHWALFYNNWDFLGRMRCVSNGLRL